MEENNKLNREQIEYIQNLVAEKFTKLVRKQSSDKKIDGKHLSELIEEELKNVMKEMGVEESCANLSVICNESNNNEETINKDEIHVNVQIKPND